MKFILNPFKKKDDELKKALRELTLYRYNLAAVDQRIKSKMQLMHGKLSMMDRNSDNAKVIANEYVALNRISQLVEQIDLLLLRVSLRLESLIEFKSLIVALQEASRSLNRLKPYLAGISDAYGMLIGQLDEALHEMGSVPLSSVGVQIPVLDENAENVLNEALNYTFVDMDANLGIKDLIFEAAKEGRLIEEVA